MARTLKTINSAKLSQRGRLQSNNGLFIILLIACFAALTIIKIYLSLRLNTPFLMMDESAYDSVAQDIIHGQLYTKYAIMGGAPPLGYPAVLTIAYQLSNDKSTIYHIMLVINALITASSVFPAYFILNKYCSRQMSLLGAVLVATIPGLFLYSFLLMTENLFIPLFIYSFWFLLESYGSKQVLWQPLAALSVVGLYITKAPGVAMIVAFVATFVYYLVANRDCNSIKNLILEKKVLLSSFILFFIAWLAFSQYVIPSGIYTNGTSNPNGSKLIGILASALKDPGVALSLANLALHEIETLLLSSYFLFLAVGTCSCALTLRDPSLRKTPLAMDTVYLIVSTALLFAMTTATMLAWNNSVDSRYIDPIVPLIFIMAMIGLEQLGRQADKTKLLASISAFLVIGIILFALNFPYGSLQFGNTISVYYAQLISQTNLIILVAGVAALSALLYYVSTINAKFRPAIPVVFICVSLLLCSQVLPFIYGMSNYFNINNSIGFYLENHSSKNTTITFDADDYNTMDGAVFYYLTIFWSKGDIVIQPESDPDYLISSKSLQYPIAVSNSNGYNFTLYTLRQNGSSLSN